MATRKPDANMAIWNQVSSTPPKAVKPIELEGRQVSSINAMFQIQRATELFGPVGQGWGFKVLVDRFDQGAPILNKDGGVLCWEQTHTLQIELWYKHAGKRWTITEFGQTPFVRKGQWGAYTDFEAPKKSLTDAIKKALSLLGFSADVYLGEWDHPAYVEGQKLKERLEEAGDGHQEVLQEARAEFMAWIKSQGEALEAAPNTRALELMHKQIAEKARAKAVVVNYNPAEVEARLREVYDARLQQLTPQTAQSRQE